MSVIVKGMKVPDTCGDCCLYSYIDNVCQYDNTDMNYVDNRPPWCPLVELPEKHGRLIDADFVTEKANHEAKAMDEPLKSNFDVLVEWIVDKTPTVIEAEGSE